MAARSSGLGSGRISGSTGPQPKGAGPSGRYEQGMRRPLVLAVCCLSLLAPAALAARSVVPPKSWDKAEIQLVVRHGLMAHSVASFRANDVLTQGELATLVAALTEQPADVPAEPEAPVTV